MPLVQNLPEIIIINLHFQIETMSRSYTISNNVIFAVNEDGSITKIATIDDNGVINNIGEKAVSPKKRSVWGYWLVIVALASIAFGVFCMYYDTNSCYQNKIYQYNEAEAQIASLKKEKETLTDAKQSAEEALSSLKEKVGSNYPLIISDIEIANKYNDGTIETGYGSTIYSSNSMFLTPRITYYGIGVGNRTLYVKLYSPDGNLSRGSSSPVGYSYSNSMYVYSGTNNTFEFSGWGNAEKGNWRSGNYRLEIWYGNTCLKSKTFTIY